MSMEEVPWIITEEVPWMHEAPSDAFEADCVFEQAETDLFQILDPSHPCIDQCDGDETDEHTLQQNECIDSIVDIQALLAHDMNDEDMALLNTCQANQELFQQTGNLTKPRDKAPKPFYNFFLGWRPQCQMHPSQYITRQHNYSARYIRFYGDEINGYLKCPHTGSAINQTLLYNPLQKPWLTPLTQITYIPGFHTMTCIGIYSMLSVGSYEENGVHVKTEKTLKNLYIMQWQQNEKMQKQAGVHNQTFPLIEVLDTFWLDQDHRIQKENPSFAFSKTSYIDLLTAYRNMQNAEELIEDMKAGACVATKVQFSELLNKRAHLIVKLRGANKEEQASLH